MITEERLMQLRAERAAEAFADAQAKALAAWAIQQAYETGKRLAAESMSWSLLIRLMDFHREFCGPVPYYPAGSGVGCMESLMGRQLLARAVLRNDQEVRAFLAGVAEVVAVV